MRIARTSYLFLAALLLPIACSVRAPAPAQNGEVALGGTSWQLVKFQSSDDKMLRPDDPAKYTIAFGADGSVSARVDCNRGRGSWKSSGPNQIQFGPLALTRALCPPGSLHDRVVKDWEFVRSYTLKDGHLFLALMADGGIYEFEPIGGSKAAAPNSRVAFRVLRDSTDLGPKDRSLAVEVSKVSIPLGSARCPLSWQS